MANLVPALNLDRLWAIQLSNSSHRKWKNNGDSLVFNWKEVDINSSASYNDISIAVAKTYPKKETPAIKNIINGIYHYSRLRKGDTILSVKGDTRIERAGIITSKGVSERLHQVTLDINWIYEVDEDTVQPVFNAGIEVQKITPTIFKKLPEDLKALASRDAESYYEISPNIDNHLREKEAEYFRSIPPAAMVIPKKVIPKGEEVVTVFYGTTRNNIGGPYNQYYGDKSSEELQFGKCAVSIPRNHEEGRLERPKKLLRIFDMPENEQKHIVIKGITELTTDQFALEVNNKLEEYPEPSAMIFIHGFNTTFAEAAQRTAQFAFDIPFKGVSSFFSWPSHGKFMDGFNKARQYAKEGDVSEAAIPQLIQFIEKFVFETKVEKIHLIGHSMGGRLLAYTMKEISGQTNFAQKLDIFSQIILAAPDISQDVFKSTILKHFKNVGERRTLYTSENDKALIVSRGIRKGLVRLGDSGKILFIDKSLDTVDASFVESEYDNNHHSYVFETQEVLSDLFYLLNKGMSPNERRLKEQLKGNLSYWLFPR